ncbi:pentapeptide repeat-containing protein [Paenibacillus phytohabitans]|uniref:pentapeptide repeat-containing protein n=1 Tax=Paenibacillus phytohabitans TaxID=2654978 RepID=UPI00300A4517
MGYTGGGCFVLIIFVILLSLVERRIAMDVLMKISEAIFKIAIPMVINKVERNEQVIRLLKQFNLDPVHPPSDFEGIYAYSIVEYGIYKPKEMIEFFRHESVKEAFKEAFDLSSPSKFLSENHSKIDWSLIEKIIDKYDYDPRKEFAKFSAVFNEIVNQSRTPAEVRREHKLDDIHNDIHKQTTNILEQLSKLDDIDLIWAQIKRIDEERKGRQFVLAPSDNKLKVFISAQTPEFRDVQEILLNALKHRGINAWVFSADEGAAPESVIETSIHQIEASDIFIGLFWKEYNELSGKNLHYARHSNKPCFIYIRDKASSREPDLLSLLQKEIFDHQKGVTYSYFDSAISLGDMVADNIMAWLLQKHREMTAELTESHIPYYEVAALKSEIKRLKSISMTELPEGTAADYLASQIRPWLEVLGYRFELHNVVADDYFEWIINIQGRRGYDRILIRGVKGEAQLGDVESIRESVEKYKTDEGWLIAARRVSQAAYKECEQEQSSNVICYTVDELLDESANFDDYLDWLEQEIKDRYIDTNYLPLNCTKDELNPVTYEKVGVSIYDESNGGIDGYIDRWLDDPDKKHISILGEFGTGKSWFTLHYAWVALQRYRDAKTRGIIRPRIPLVIPLRDYAKAVSVESLFSEFFFRKHKIDLPNYGAFEQLNRMGKLLLIFDGFDEMAAKVDRQSMINNFWELAKVVKPGAKAILTCRTEHFPEAREGRSLLNAELLASTSALTGEPPQFEVLELLKLNNNQVRQVLARQTTENIVDSIMENEELLELVGRPIMIEFILDAIPDIDSGKPIDLSRIYLYAVQRKMDRDITEMRTFTSMADKMYFLCEIAWEMLSNDQMSLNYREFPDRINRYFGNTVQGQKNLDHWHYDMMGQTMLIRNSDGDYSPAHRSLLEFFVAYKFVSELGLLAEDFVHPARSQSNLDELGLYVNYTWSNYFNRKIDETGKIINISPLNNFVMENNTNLVMTFGFQPLSKALKDLMINMVDNDKKSNLLQVITNTKFKSSDENRVVGGNAATILNLIDATYCKGRDLSYTNLNKADLTNMDLSECIMNHAELEQVDFDNANLFKASLKSAQLSGSNFYGTNMRETVLTGAYMSEVDILDTFGWIRSTNSKEGRIIFYYSNEAELDTPQVPLEIIDGEIAVALVDDNTIKWINKFCSSYILKYQFNDEDFYLLTIEKELYCFRIKTGERILTDVENMVSFFNWSGALLNEVHGLDDYNKHIIRVFGGITEDVKFDITTKRWGYFFKRSSQEIASTQEVIDDLFEEI